MKNFYCIYDNRKFEILVGQNAKENWKLIDSADYFDLWFHVDNHPSGHAVIKEILIPNNNKHSTKINYPYDIILEGARHCKNQSKLKNQQCKIIYTTINNISKGKEIGSVYTKHEKYIIL